MPGLAQKWENEKCETATHTEPQARLDNSHLTCLLTDPQQAQPKSSETSIQTYLGSPDPQMCGQ